MAYNPNNPNGQALAANSAPVVLAVADSTTSGSITAAAQTVVLTVSAGSSASFQLSGTWVATLSFEGTLDGTLWNPINAVSSSTSSPSSTTTANGLYRLTPGGLFQIRVNATAFTSGTVTVNGRASTGSSGTFANQILPTKITDGISSAAIKPASTAPVATDSALVVSLSPNSALPTGAATETTLSALNTKVPANLTVTATRLLVDASGTTQPVSGTVVVTQATGTNLHAVIDSSALPAGAATETTLAALNTKVTTTVNGIKVDGSAVTQPISAAALPLPTGAATSASQATGNTSLGSIDTKVPPLGQALATASVPVVLTAAQISTLTPLTTVTANIGTTGGLALDATVAKDATLTGGTARAIVRSATKGTTTAADVTSTNVDANTQALDVSVKGTVATTLSGTPAVSVSNFPATQAISAVSLPLPTGAATETTLAALNTKVTAVNTGAVTISTALPTGANSIGQVTANAGTNLNTSLLALDATVNALLKPASTLAAVTTVSAVTAITNALPVGANVIGKVSIDQTTPGTTNLVALTAETTKIIGTVSLVDGLKATYSATIPSLVVAALPTDIFTLTGSATKTIRVTRISATGTQTTAAQVALIVLKRSTANTLGTSTAVTAVPYNSTNAAATATVLAYTVSPTVGTLVGNLRARKVFVGTAAGTSDEYLSDFGIRNNQAIVVRGINEVLAINLAGAAVAGGNFTLSIEWTEE